MGKAKEYQCQHCGKIHKIDKVGKSREDIYYDVFCPSCKSVTPHLDVGDSDERYWLINNLLDGRYFEYGKTQHND